MTALERRLSALKLSEPVRLYLYGIGSVLITACVLAGALTGQWQAFAPLALGALLGLSGTELARASVYSPAGQITAMRRIRTGLDLATALGEDVT